MHMYNACLNCVASLKSLACILEEKLQSQDLVGCFGLNCSSKQYFSLDQAVSQKKGESKEMIDVRINVRTTPTRTNCKRPTLIQINRSPRHWKFTQHHRTTRQPPQSKARHYVTSYVTYWAKISKPLKGTYFCKTKWNHSSLYTVGAVVETTHKARK